jgi:excisionase family DNA binding protein
LQSQVTFTLTGLEDLIERIVDERIRAALADREPDPWLTSDEAAQYLGVARSTLHDLVCDGKLPRHGVKGHRLRFRREDLDSYARRG